MSYDPLSGFKAKIRGVVACYLENYPDWKRPEYPWIRFLFYMPIPKSLSKKDRALAESGILRHTKKPDVDNLIKLYLDTLKGSVLNDDNCVAITSAVKLYSKRPTTMIFIHEGTPNITQNELYGNAA